jgi:hypothetical protein
MNEFFINSHIDLKEVFFKILSSRDFPQQKIVLNVKLWEDDSDAKNSRFFLKLMNLLEDYQYSTKGKVIINWYYPPDNEEIAEAGREFAEDVKLEFNVIPFN